MNQSVPHRSNRSSRRYERFDQNNCHFNIIQRFLYRSPYHSRYRSRSRSRSRVRRHERSRSKSISNRKHHCRSPTPELKIKKKSRLYDSGDLDDSRYRKHSMDMIDGVVSISDLV